ncbi:hypothetical protein PPYR_12429 [Photinus pyralis]|uniref:RING-type E3 ubiquitin transferase n=1 Tax=Photinus pyralis TaxID=7054 RepID=A0A1Y1K2J0_PHOPY|nr:mitochondrial E3 ubiquitin protein ligase 1 [Photinus pyralis]KAB0795590.1 hypothetical protein PPYR_12429 [Photinus pyralis]
MDYLVEIIALTIDSVCLVGYYVNYLKTKNSITLIENSPVLEINKNLPKIVNKQPGQIIPYVAIRGTVQPIGDPIISNNNLKVAGVLQLLTIKEHIIQRGATGYWSEHEKVIQTVQNVMPFVIESHGYNVEVVDALSADILDLDVISNVFTPTVPKLVDHIWGFFTGFRQRGVQTTEEMLRKGTVITGIGELIISEDKGGVRLQPPRDGSPFYLTNMSITSLLKKLDEQQRTYRLFCILFGTIGIVVGGLIIRRYLRNRSQWMESERKKKERESIRKERRRRVRGDELSDSQLCVVCKVNPKEVILLPCGHVCLCEDCSEEITDLCPICREVIDKQTAAYLS